MRSTTRLRLEDCTAVSAGLIRFYVARDDRSRVSVLGRVVDVAPHLSATFAVHEAVNAQGWSVSDIDSGGRAGFSRFSEDRAIKDAAQDLATRTDADMRRARERLQRLTEAA